MHFSLEFWGNFSPAFPSLKVLVACYFLDHSFLTEEKSLSDILCSELCKGVAEHKHATVSAIEMYSTKIPPLTTPDNKEQHQTPLFSIFSLNTCNTKGIYIICDAITVHTHTVAPLYE